MAFDGLHPVLENPIVAPEVEHISPEEEAYLAAEQEALREMEAREAPSVGSASTLETSAIEKQIETGSGVDPLVADIENILKVDLTKILKAPLSAEANNRFVADEIALAHRIFGMKDKLDPHDVVKWIERWLHQLPGVNKPYLALEARNKTEAIVLLINAGSS